MNKQLKVGLLESNASPEELVVVAALRCTSDEEISKFIGDVHSKNSAKIIQDLLERRHLSVFEHVVFTFAIEGISRACANQLVRHRLASYSQQSQRYVKEESFDYIIPNSIKNCNSFPSSIYGKTLPGNEYIEEKMKIIQSWYNEMIEHGIPKEDARCILPNACETKLIVTMNARELLHFFELRCCFKAQEEIQNLAIAMLKLVIDVAPTIFKDAGPCCISSQCREGKRSCGKSEEIKKLL